MKSFSKYVLLIAPFLIFSTISSGRIDPKSIGKTVDESVVLKNKKSSHRKVADKGFDLLSVFKKFDAKVNKQVNISKNNSNTEVFILETVNGEDITNVDVINIIKLMFFFSGKKYNAVDARIMVPAVLSSLEDDNLRRQCAKAFDLQVSESDIDERISELARSNNISVSDMEKSFEDSGISMKIFRENVKSKMVFQTMAEAFSENGDVSNSELVAAKNEEASLLKTTRYYVAEIFRYDEESAKQLLKLAQNGFSFQLLAENFSQKIASKAPVNWIKESDVEPEILAKLKTMSIGEYSPVIKTKTGYKIVCLIDKASPGKVGTSEVTYNILKTSFPYQGKLFTEKDMQNIEKQIGEFVNSDTVKSYKDLCKKYNLKFEEIELSQPDPYNMELINRAKTSKKTAILQDMDDPNKLNVVFLVREDIPDASMPSDEELKRGIREKKVEDEFTRNFKQLKSKTHIEKREKNIRKVIS